MQTKVIWTTIGILVTLLGWLGSIQVQKLTDIEKSLIELKLEVTKVQMSMIDESKVKEIVDHELLRRGL